MSLDHGPEETVDEGLLVRHLHGEVDEAEALALRAHLNACGACRAAVDALAERSRRVGETLRAADWAQPGPDEWARVLDRIRTRSARSRPRHVRIAAGIVLALAVGASMASASVRGWVADRWAQWFSEDASQAAPVPESGVAGRADLAFLPAGPNVELTFDALPVSGVLTIRFGEGDRATLTVSGGGDERLAVGERGVTIRNVVGSRASWEVVLPAGVERVSVHVGGLDPVELTRSGQGGDPVDVDLARGAVRNPGLRDEP